MAKQIVINLKQLRAYNVLPDGVEYNLQLKAKADEITSSSLSTPVEFLKYGNPRNWLTFKGNGSFSINGDYLSHSGRYGIAKVYYSLDGTNWQEWDKSTITAQHVVGRGYFLHLCGIGNYCMRGSNNFDAGLQFINNDVNVNLEIECQGDIGSLLDYPTYDKGLKVELGERSCQFLFLNCQYLKTPPTLSPTYFTGRYVYFGMFMGCTKLESSPILPATDLVYRGYLQMFYGCTSLKRLGAILGNKTDSTSPATLMQQMFSGCTSLKVSTTQSSEYPYAFPIPRTLDSSFTTNQTNSFENTGGSYTGDIVPNTTYYLHDEPILS